MRILVTGGGGFLGGAIVRRLVARGDDARAFQRGDYPELGRLGATAIRGDVTDAEALVRAADGCDVVVHTAAKAGVWGRYDEYHHVNVVGTRNVIEACRRAGVTRLVYTSSPSVVFDGRDEEGIDETAPYCRRYLAAYPRSKALAEQLALAANGPDLATVALRPHLIWGPGDPHLVPRILDRARSGRLRLVGRGDNRVDSTFIDNAAAAHLAAVDRLSRGAVCAGKAYFISNGEPLPMRELVNRILSAGGFPPLTRRISPRLAFSVGVFLEGGYRLCRIQHEPIMTRFVALQLATAHWFDISAARRDLGYKVEVSLVEGFARLRESLLK
jgi:nucleoside-diphosphate-sugar epimerase